FGDDTVDTAFRDHVDRIVAARGPNAGQDSLEWRPTMSELTAGGYFRHVRSDRWRWTVDLTTDQVTRLFRTFSGWTDAEVDAVRAAADTCGGVVTEHYQSVLHLLVCA